MGEAEEWGHFGAADGVQVVEKFEGLLRAREKVVRCELFSGLRLKSRMVLSLRR